MEGKGCRRGCAMAQQGPKYQQVIDWFMGELASGKLKYGDRMPSEKELSEQFGLSRQTVRHATGELMSRRLVTRVQGSGTYVGGSYLMHREAKHMRIAVLSTFYESYIFPPTLKGIGEELSGAGYAMEVAFTDNLVHRESEILKGLLQKDNIDGMIVEPSKSSLPNPNLKYYREFQERGIPVIFFNAYYPELDAPCVRIDDTKIAGKAAKILIDAGHQKIAGIFKADDGQGRLRYAGYAQALEEAGLPMDQFDVLWIDTPATLDLSKMSEYLFYRLQGHTGVVCYNDQVASQLIDLAVTRGMRVPEDLSVVGIDDSYLANMSRVPLTSFPHPKAELGQKVAHNLLEMIRNPEFDGNYLYDADPVVRDSVQKLR